MQITSSNKAQLTKPKPTVLFGGTFNPPHLGHIKPLQWAMDSLNIQHVGLMPCNIPPHKEKLNIGNQHRLAMLNLVCEIDKRFYVEAIELQREKTSFTVDTLKALKADNNECIWLIMGTDSFNSLHTWHEWECLLSLCNIIVLKRHEQALTHYPQISRYYELSATPESAGSQPLSDINQIKPNFGVVVSAHCPLINVSSTELRALLADTNNRKTANRSILLPQTVLNYALEHHLYEQ